MIPTDLYKGNYFDVAGGYYSRQTEAFSDFMKTNIREICLTFSDIDVQLIIETLYQSNKRQKQSRQYF